MIMIPVMHILGHGGILDNVKPFSANYEISWMFECFTYCASNCFALITGYVCVGREVKYKNIINLNFQVVFYTICTTVIFGLIDRRTINLKIIIQALFPFAYSTYWYFSAYFGMFFFIPYFNFFINKIPQDCYKKLLVSLLIIFSICPTLFHHDFASTSWGFSTLWLSVLYFIGAFLKKYGSAFSTTQCFALYLFCALFTWASKVIIELLTNKVLGTPIGGGYLLQYTSPTILACAIFLLIGFSKIRLKGRVIRCIEFLAPLSFGSYLFQEEPLIKNYLVEGNFEFAVNFNPLLFILFVFCSSVVIWIIGSFVDGLRQLVYKFLRVDFLAIKLEKVFVKFFYKISFLINNIG